MKGIVKVTLFFLSVFSFADKAEFDMAREAAPDHITKDASYMIWQKDRFVKKVSGTNGFTCFVLRDNKGRYEPSCLNKAAMKSVLPVYNYQTKMLQEEVNIKTIYEGIEKRANSGVFPKPEPGAVVYMMSPKNKFYDHFNSKLLDIAPHIMLYFPKIDERSLGFNNKDGLPMFYHEYPHLSVIHIDTDG